MTLDLRPEVAMNLPLLSASRKMLAKNFAAQARSNRFHSSSSGHLQIVRTEAAGGGGDGLKKVLTSCRQRTSRPGRSRASSRSDSAEVVEQTSTSNDFGRCRSRRSP